jgi:FMN-binding protein
MRRVAFVALVVAAVMATPVSAAVVMTQEKALATAFPAGAAVERQTSFLTDAQLARARELAGPGIEIASALVTRYVARGGAGAIVGTAYFDTHRVRTLQETLMIVVGPDGKVGRVDVLAFGEPPEYLPKKGWLDQFAGHGLDGELSVKRGIHGITGATLSSQAATDAVRRVLAIHAVLP